MKCKSKIVFGDDYGDNDCTFHCGLEAGHKGPHKECGNMYGSQDYVVSWVGEYIDPLDSGDIEECQGT